MSKQAVLTEYDLKTEYPLKSTLVFAHVSDIHERKAEDVLSRLKTLSPDLIFVTGDTFERYDNRPQYDFDRKPIKKVIINAIHYTNWLLNLFVSKKRRPDEENAFRFLKEATQVAPVLLSLGNHEQTLFDEDKKRLEDCGVTLLDNRFVRVTVRNDELLVGGLSTWDFEPFLESFKQQKGFKILLSHHPERFEPYLLDSDIALTLSGHTHGGQFRVGRKGRGFFVPGQGLFGKLAHGVFFDGRLVVSAGCSNTVAFPRLFNPRELVLIRLSSKTAKTTTEVKA